VVAAWCCNIVQENCVSNGFSSNGCWMKIPNPLRNESNDTYTTVKNMTLTGPTGVGTSVITSTGVQETASTTRSSGGGVSTAADSGSGVGDGTSDAGVIGGATTGGLVLGLIVAGVIWLLRRHSRKKALISQPVQYGEQKEGDNWYYGYGTRQPCELADESVGPRELPAHGTNVEVPS